MLGLAAFFSLAGFDVIYSLQDCEFDREQGLYSVPVRFGIAGAPRLSSFDHVFTVVFLALVGLTAQEGVIYWLGFAAVAIALFWEYRIVSPNDLSSIALSLTTTLTSVSATFSPLSPTPS